MNRVAQGIGLSVLWLTFLGTCYAGSGTPLKVAVNCRGEDLIGQQVCYRLKEDIRASKGFELIVEQVDAFEVNVVALPIDDDKSAIEATFRVKTPSRQYLIGILIKTFTFADGRESERLPRKS